MILNKLEPDLRKFFINTIFDSTFTVLGIVSGSAFAGDSTTVLITLFTSCVALGFSSGISVYEAKVLEGERSINEIEKAMITDLKNTVLSDNVKNWLLGRL
jgi:hypothetical protein